MIGRTLGARYDVEARIGGGGMATVYRGVDTFLRRQVALKVLRAQFAGDAQFVARFRREARAAASLSHPNIVAVYDVGQEDDDCHFIVQEYIDGRTLKERIETEGPLAPEEALRITVQVLRALGAAHAAGVVHRDVKPQNVLLTAGGAVKVTDFGIAQADASVTMAHSGAIVGTAHYAAPEQVRGLPTDERCDLYSTGVMLYEMLTGRPPFDGEGPLAVAMQHVQEPVPDPAQVRPDLPPPVCALVRHAMQKAADRRYATTAEFEADVEAVLAGRPPIHAETSPAAQPVEEDVPDAAAEEVGAALEEELPEDDDPPPSPPPARGGGLARAMGIAAGLVVGLGLLAGGGAFLAMRYLVVPTVAVPNVAGDDLGTAQQALANVGLRYFIQQENDPSVPMGNVVSTDPQGGSSVKRNSRIELWLSYGAGMVTMPNVVGLRQDEATSELQQQGLTVQVAAAPQFSPTVPAGSVAVSLPAAGAQVPGGSTVTLTISAGSQGSGAVPDYVGQAASAVQADIVQRGWKVGKTSAQQSGWPAGTVVATDPLAGAPALPGQAVNLTVSSGCVYEETQTFSASGTSGGAPAAGPSVTGGGIGVGTPGFSATSSSASATSSTSSSSSSGTGPASGVRETFFVTDDGQSVARKIFDKLVAPGQSFSVPFCWSSPQGATYSWQENGVSVETGTLTSTAATKTPASAASTSQSPSSAGGASNASGSGGTT